MRARAPEASRVAPRLIAVDLDGTLLDASGVPFVRDVEALRAAISAGIIVSIVTGRLYSGTRFSAECIGVRGPVGCADGSHIVNVVDHTTLYHDGIRGDHARILRDSLARHRPATFLFTDDSILHDDAGEPLLAYVRTWSKNMHRAPCIHKHRAWDAERGLTAVVAIGTERQIVGAAAQTSDALAGVAQVAAFPIRRLPEMWGLVVRAAGHTKASALRFIAEHHGIAMHQTVCVGDWLNDVPMLLAAGRSFAMPHAPDEVKSSATDVLEATGPSGGGVAAAVKIAFDLRV